jgi:hypothetical protein
MTDDDDFDAGLDAACGPGTAARLRADCLKRRREGALQEARGMDLMHLASAAFGDLEAITVELPGGTRRRLAIAGFPHELEAEDVARFLIEQGLAILEKRT